MSSRHPLPYAFAKAHHVLLEDQGHECVLWSAENTALSALGEVSRLFTVTRHEREVASTLDSRIAVVYAGSESSAATVVGEEIGRAHV